SYSTLCCLPAYSFPTRRSSDLQNLPYKTRFIKSRLYISALMPISVGFVGGLMISILGIGGGFIMVPAMIYILGMPSLLVAGTSLDRKSTRLNSSHVKISYAVFC